MKMTGKAYQGGLIQFGGMITNWSSKKQTTVSLSSTEAEYQSLSECAQEVIFTQNMIQEITGKFMIGVIYEDNLGAIYLVKNQQVSPRTKHIDVRHHFLRELQGPRLDIRFIKSANNSSDIMTKNTNKELFEKHSYVIRNGLLTYLGEDVKSDPSVTLFEDKRNDSMTVENDQENNSKTDYNSCIPNMNNHLKGKEKCVSLCLKPR